MWCIPTSIYLWNSIEPLSWWIFLRNVHFGWLRLFWWWASACHAVETFLTRILVWCIHHRFLFCNLSFTACNCRRFHVLSLTELVGIVLMIFFLASSCVTNLSSAWLLPAVYWALGCYFWFKYPTPRSLILQIGRWFIHDIFVVFIIPLGVRNGV